MIRLLKPKKEEEEWPPPKCNVSSSTELPSFVADSVPAKQGGGRADSEYSTESRYHSKPLSAPYVPWRIAYCGFYRVAVLGNSV